MAYYNSGVTDLSIWRKNNIWRKKTLEPQPSL